jgi:hypothetical protein
MYHPHLADRIGIWTSTLCVVHCLFTPILLSISTVLAHFLPSEEVVNRSLAVAIAAIGAVALLRGFRRHRRARVLSFSGVGLTFIFSAAWWADSLPHHWMNVTITFVGSALMITAHRLNHTFCRGCSCAGHCRT